MSEPTPYSFSHHLTELIGRKVTFAQTTVTIDGPIKQVYAIYTVLPGNTAIVVKADLPLLASFAGVLVGLPDATVKERLRESMLDELLRDAMHEILNITSTVVTTAGRAIFQDMFMDKAYVVGAAEAVLLKPGHRSYFNVTLDGYQGGRFTLLSPILAVYP